MPSANWTAYFTSLTGNDQENKNTTIYTEAWAQNKSHAAKMMLLTNDANTLILGTNINQGSTAL